MRALNIFLLIIVIAGSLLCCNDTSNSPVQTSVVEESFRLQGIPVDKSLLFDQDRVFYTSMDNSERYSVNCFSITGKKLKWSVPVHEIGIKAGVLTSTREYVMPLLSDKVYLINPTGSYRVLRLEDRCKISPLAIGNTFILQDRGRGLKCFDAKSLHQLWVIKQNSDFTMSQPVILDSNIIYIPDVYNIQSSAVSNGKLNWSIPLKNSLSIQLIYGIDKHIVFVLATDLDHERLLTAVDGSNGKVLWNQKIDNSVDVWETSMLVTNEKLFCKGDSSIFTYSLQDGKCLEIYDFKSRIVTNLVTDSGGNVLVGLEKKALMKIDKNRKTILVSSFENKLNRLYRSGERVFLLSYPDLFLLK